MRWYGLLAITTTFFEVMNSAGYSPMQVIIVTVTSFLFVTPISLVMKCLYKPSKKKEDENKKKIMIKDSEKKADPKSEKDRTQKEKKEKEKQREKEMESEMNLTSKKKVKAGEEERDG
mmetsp:Transcript_29610/g.27059  ORF Transcript_29610/g.27059 Transcript_29610/m.27059 type:complete len:118 (-) Transcript_29610:274-627(-)